jgi:hypothetical protein
VPPETSLPGIEETDSVIPPHVDSESVTKPVPLVLAYQLNRALVAVSFEVEFPQITKPGGESVKPHEEVAV